jgi:hypothetical protein
MKEILEKKKDSPNVVLLNYADSIYRKSQKLNSKTGKSIGQFDSIISYSPKDIDHTFHSLNKKILNQKRGNGYWLWKPYLIKKTLEELNWGDFLFYCDSGSHFTKSIQELIHFSLEKKQDIIPFEITHFEREWTKRDTFILMEYDDNDYQNSKQRLSGFVLLRKSELSLKFVNDWLTYAQDERILTDIENQCGHPNHNGFKEHRHDQSIFSLLTKKYGFKAYRDPSQYGSDLKHLYPDSNYEQFIMLTRIRNFPIHIKLIKYLRRNKFIKKKILVIIRNLRIYNTF